jgi:hypothetical protein
MNLLGLNEFQAWLNKPAVWREHIAPGQDREVECVVCDARSIFGRTELQIEPTDPPRPKTWVRVERVKLR